MSYFKDLKSGFDQKDLKRFYIKLVKAHSPELDPENFQKINEEYESLLLRFKYTGVVEQPLYEGSGLEYSDDLEDCDEDDRLDLYEEKQEANHDQVEQTGVAIDDLGFDPHELPEKLSFEQLLCIEVGTEEFLKIFKTWLDKGGIKYCINHIETVFDQLEQVGGISSLDRVSYYAENNLQIVLPVVSWLHLSRTHKIKQHMDHAFKYLDQEGGVHLYDDLHRSFAQMRYQCRSGAFADQYMFLIFTKQYVRSRTHFEAIRAFLSSLDQKQRTQLRLLYRMFRKDVDKKELHFETFAYHPKEYFPLLKESEQKIIKRRASLKLWVMFVIYFVYSIYAAYQLYLNNGWDIFNIWIFVIVTLIYSVVFALLLWSSAFALFFLVPKSKKHLLFEREVYVRYELRRRMNVLNSKSSLAYKAISLLCIAYLKSPFIEGGYLRDPYHAVI